MPAPAVYTLPSGLRVVLVPDGRSPAAAFYMWVKVGSADEQRDEAGLAHVLEHMLFKGTPTRGVGEIAQQIEGCGGDINAYTSFDTTVYHLVLASRFFDTGLDVIVDAVTRSTIDANELALEKEVILEEIKRDEDQPSRKVSHALFTQAYRKHPYGRPVIGTRALVAGYDRPKVAGFYERWYVPKNMLLVVAGNFDVREAKTKIARATKHFTGPRPPARSRAAEPVQKDFRGAIVDSDIREIHLETGFHIPGLAHRDVPAIDALAIALGQGDRARLPWRVRRGKRLVTSVGSYAFTPADPGLFFVSASVPADKGEAGITETLKETFRLWREPPTDEELERAKVSIEGDAIYERETVQGIAKKVGFYEAIGGGMAEEQKYMKAIRALTPADLARVARSYLHPDNLTVAALGPAGSIPSIAKIGAAARESFKAAQPAVARKAKARAKARGPREPETRHVLPGGATLLVRRDGAVPLISIRSVCLGGLRFEDEKTAGNTHMVARVLCKGTANRSYAEIVRSVDRFAGGVSGFSGFNSFGVRMDALARHQAEAIELYTEILQRPTFEQREVEQERTQVLESLKSLEDHPSAWVMRLFTRALYTKHPYRLSMIGEAARIGQIQSPELASFYERIAVPENLSIAVVGDVDPSEIVDRFGEQLAGFGSGRTFETPDVPVEPPVGSPRTVSVPKTREQVHLALGFLGASLQDEQRFALELIASALSGQGGRLFLELRDKQGLAYSVTAFSQEALDPGYFCVYMATDPKKRERALDGIRAELEKLCREGLTADELARNQRQIVGSFEIDLQRGSTRAANMAFNDRYGLGFQDYREYPKRILAVTRDQIVDAARRYIDLDRSVLAIVGPDAEQKLATA